MEFLALALWTALGLVAYTYAKRLDSRLSSVMGAAGELVAIRGSCWEPVEPDTIIEDFVLSMRLVQRGLRVVYEPAAYAAEEAALPLRDEFERKVWIVAGATAGHLGEGPAHALRLNERLPWLDRGEAQDRWA